jgi:serine phosphatase RsbU (regulator of sigma subunit)
MLGDHFDAHRPNARMTAMWKPPIPPDEAERLQDLRRLDILLTTPEEPLDRVTRQLAKIFDVPGAFISFIDEDTQYYKSEVGLPPEFAATRSEPRDLSVCSHVVGTNEMLVVEDLSADSRFRDNPAVIEFGIRFYAGTPLRGDGGHGVGSLCIVDDRPRTITPREQQMLGLLAEGVMAQVKLQSASRQLLRRSMQIERDLEQAIQVQRYLLPDDRIDAGGWRIRHLYRPAAHLGGDFVDVIKRPNGQVAVIVADVSGHGTSAALTAMMAKIAFSRAGSSAATPAGILTAINRDLAGMARPGQFITALAAVLEPSSRTMTLASAGHPYPLLVSASGSVPVRIDNEPPLLVRPGVDYGRETTLRLDARTRVVAFTDGAIEVACPDGRMLGADGLGRLARALAGSDGRFLAALLEGVQAQARGRLDDDVALMSLEAID